MALEILPPGEGQMLEMAVTLAEAKAYLKAIGDSESYTIRMMIEAAQLKVEAATDRLLIERSCRFTTDAFGNAVLLPVRPVQAGSAVTYHDAAGNLQTLDPALYRLVDRLERPRIVPAPGASFPSTWELPSGVVVEFTAGYGPIGENVPTDLRIAILKIVRDTWSFRGDLSTLRVSSLPNGVQATIDDYRRWVV